MQIYSYFYIYSAYCLQHTVKYNLLFDQGYSPDKHQLRYSLKS